MNMKEKLQSLVQNSIVLDISEELEKYEACSTHFGGQPDVPADFQWPRYQGKGYNYECEERPLTFLAQFNCAEFTALDARHILPDHGLLSFFYEMDSQPWGFAPEHKGALKVYWFEDLSTLSRVEFPEDMEEDFQFPAINKEAGGIVLMRGYKDYYFGYEDADGKHHPGYQDMIEELTTKFPLTEERITGEQRQKEFIVLFGAILRMRNLLTSFDEFAGSEILSERDFQDYLGRYQDLRDEWKNRKPGGEKEDITDDIVFEIELIKQIEINIDYILMLVQKYHDSHCDDKEILITIQKAVDASPELRSKKALIETFIAGINDVSDVMLEWRTFVAEEKERQLVTIIQEENLKDEETRRFMDSAFRDGSVKTTGTDIDKLMPPISRFSGGNRAEKKQTIIEKLKGFFDRFFGIG